MEAWRIERLAASDWARLRAVRLRALADAPDAFGTTLAQDEGRPLEEWAARLADQQGATFAASADGADIGVVTGHTLAADGNFAGLFGMWVAPSHRRLGVAGALVDAVVGWARDRRCSRLLLDVADANSGAVALYEKKGFRPTGVRGSLPAPRDQILEHQRSLEL